MKKHDYIRPFHTAELSGTWLRGYVIANYSDINKAMGKQSEGDDYKIDAIWTGFIKGRPFSIYNYKDGKNYNGKNGTPKTQITTWHIGGNDSLSESHMMEIAEFVGGTYMNMDDWHNKRIKEINARMA